MRFPPVPLFVLLVITLLADFFVYRRIYDRFVPSLYEMPYWALMLAQAGLLAIWFTLGRAYLLVRLLAIIGGIAWLSYSQPQKIILSELHFIVLVELVIAVALTAALRFAGFMWARPSLNLQEQPTRLRQFELRELLTWTAAIAVMTFAIRRIEHDQFQSPSMLILAALWAVLSLLPLMLALPRMRPFVSLAIVLFTTSAVGVFAAHPDGRWYMFTLFATTSLIQCIWILTARVCGFRIMRVRLSDAPVKQIEQDPWSGEAGP